MPYIPSFPTHHGMAHNALVMGKNRKAMFVTILKATTKLYLQMGITFSMFLGSLYFFFGNAFAKVVQHFFHALGSTFLHLASINNKRSVW